LLNAEDKPARQSLHLQESRDNPTISDPVTSEDEWDAVGHQVVEGASSEAPPALSRGRAVLSLLGELAETVLLAFIIFLLIRTALQTYRVDGSSMEPNFYDGQFLVVDKVTPRIFPIKRGDVVVFHFPGSQERDYIKRVVGLPGETVEIREGVVYVNERALDEPYETYPTGYSWGPASVGEDQFFVLGDNRNHSSDSHSWGTLDRRQLVGRAWLMYWPLESWGLVPRYSDVAAEPR